ncbi:helix-turn-helix domain-containing protein [Nonomuraea sp. NPDC050790]|uniref:helix-turn-helix domain-containing protein n=1 Tax=Nonomuraea sp. NPDC050790 TaxID=3364371 RepID=UPI00379AB92D
MGDTTEPDQSVEDSQAKGPIRLGELRTDKELLAAFRVLFDASGVSVNQLARKVGLRPSSVQAVLDGQRMPGLLRMRALLNALDVPEDYRGIWTIAQLRLASDGLLGGHASGTTAAEWAARRDLSEAENELTETDELTLPALWKVTHKRLDYYHEIATGQARQSFRNAQIAMGLGFLLLVAFAVLTLVAQSTAAAIVTGALGATSAAFAAYISKTFVRSQETSAAHLRSYFDQPLEFSRYLAAERLLNGVDKLEPEQRAVIVADVLRGILPGSNASESGKSSPEE